MLPFSKKGHPYPHCTNNKKKKDDDNNKSNYSKNIKTSIKNLHKYMKKAKKTFTTLQAKMLELK